MKSNLFLGLFGVCMSLLFFFECLFVWRCVFTRVEIAIVEFFHATFQFNKTITITISSETCCLFLYFLFLNLDKHRVHNINIEISKMARILSLREKERQVVQVGFRTISGHKGNSVVWASDNGFGWLRNRDNGAVSVWCLLNFSDVFVSLVLSWTFCLSMHLRPCVCIAFSKFQDSIRNVA